MSILVFNAGSSSLKFGLFEETSSETVASGYIDWANGNRDRATLRLRGPDGTQTCTEVAVPDDRAATWCAINSLRNLKQTLPRPWSPIEVTGHRVVHCGADFSESVRIDDKVKNAIERWAKLAPLHNPPAMAAIAAAEDALPDAVHVAVFDTAFCAALSQRAYMFPIPHRWYENWGVRKFGFHGISHKYCTQRAADMLGRKLEDLRIVSCHLGGGCSAIAVQGGVPLATTMGFTPLDGLMMGTRPGSIDPGVIIYLEECCGMTAAEIHDTLNYESGLLGVSGVSPNIVEIEKAAANGNNWATLALEMFCDRVRSAIASLTVTMGGIDVLLFTDRVGEGSPNIRAMICQQLDCLGLRLDPRRNLELQPDADLSPADASARILAIRTKEEWMIAREAIHVLKPECRQP
jgi:acetate kinase